MEIAIWLNTSGGVTMDANIKIITKAYFLQIFNFLEDINLNLPKK